MNGALALRGFLLQTIIGLLEILEQENSFSEIGIEPDIGSEKVDIIIVNPQRKKVIQVKSSQNQISTALVNGWATELITSIQADEYELILIGPTSKGVAETRIVAGVSVPLPKVLDSLSLIEQAAQKLDKYLHSRGFLAIPPFVREDFIESFITKLQVYSTKQQLIKRVDVDELIQSWVIEIYPQAINRSLSMQCELLVDNILFLAKQGDGLPVMLQCGFVNDGARTAVIEWIAFTAEGNNTLKLYTPLTINDPEKFFQGKRTMHGENISSPFSEFAISPNQSKELFISFNQEENGLKEAPTAWTAGKYIFKFYIKFRDSPSPKLRKQMEVNIDYTMLVDISRGSSITLMTRKIKI